MFQKTILTLTAALSLALLVNCSKSSSGGGSSSAAADTTLTVSGTLSTASASILSIDPNDENVKMHANGENSAFAITDLQLYAFCFSTPPTVGSVSINADGTFSLSIAGALGAPCSFIFRKISDGSQVGLVKFTDSTQQDLNGNPKSSTSISFNGATSLGSISLASDGSVTIPVATITTVSTTTVAAASAADFTGTWTAAAVDATLIPSGYVTATAACTSGNCDNKGPSIGDSISLIRFHGNDFTPASGKCTVTNGNLSGSCAAADGTVGTKDLYAISIWGGDYTHGIGACGGKTGFTLDEGRAFAHINLDTTAPSLAGNALTYGDYTFTSGSAFGGDAGWTSSWMATGATSSYNVQNCIPVMVPSTSGAAAQSGYACWSPVNVTAQATPVPTPLANTFVWNVGLQSSGGCTDTTTGKPVMVTNWQNINGSNSNTCTNATSTFNSHMNTNTCTYTASIDGTAAATTFKCVFTGGMFNDTQSSTTASGFGGPDFTTVATGLGCTGTGMNWSCKFPGQPATILAQGATCAGSTSEATLKSTAAGTNGAADAARAELMARYRCYANAYWQNANNRSGCVQQYNFDWSTNDPLKFVISDRNKRPNNAFMTELITYTPDGQSASTDHQEMQMQSVPTPNGSQICKISQEIKLSFHKNSASQLLVDLSQLAHMADTSTVCQAAVSAAMAGKGALTSDPQGLNSLYKELQPQHSIFYLNK